MDPQRYITHQQALQLAPFKHNKARYVTKAMYISRRCFYLDWRGPRDKALGARAIDEASKFYQPDNIILTSQEILEGLRTINPATSRAFLPNALVPFDDRYSEKRFWDLRVRYFEHEANLQIVRDNAEDIYWEDDEILSHQDIRERESLFFIVPYLPRPSAPIAIDNGLYGMRAETARILVC